MNENKLTWIPLTKENEPDNEVLLANFKEGNFGYKCFVLGYVSYEEELGIFVGGNEHEELHNCTHFIDPNTIELEQENECN